jgi:uncharacterized protein (DUF1697 family)
MMASVVLLKGINVGGHRTFRPSVLAAQLKRFDVVNVGAAGTFVVRKPVSQAMLRAEVERLLPFAADVMICRGSDVLRLVASNPFARQRESKEIVRFVSVLARRRGLPSPAPLNLPNSGAWSLKILGQQDRFVFGLYRREMRAIGYLGQIETIFGVPVTTRNWNTIMAIVRVLERAASGEA